MSSYNKDYTQQKASNPKLTDCVSPAPFYDTSANTCVECPSDYPYFNLDTNRCQNCGSGTYNASAFACEASSESTLEYKPTLSRLVMNIL